LEISSDVEDTFINLKEQENFFNLLDKSNSEELENIPEQSSSDLANSELNLEEIIETKLYYKPITDSYMLLV